MLKKNGNYNIPEKFCSTKIILGRMQIEVYLYKEN